MIAGAAAVAIAAIVLTGLFRGSVVRPDPAAAAVLKRAARAAEVSGGPGLLGPGEYWYVRSRFASLTHSSVGDGRLYEALVTYEIESWTARNGSGRVVQLPIRTSFPNAHDRQEWEQVGRPVLMRNSTQTVRPTPKWITIGRGMTYAQMIALPTNVAALTHRLAAGPRGSAQSRRDALFTTIGDLLRENPVPAAIRAALYRIAGGIPGIRLARSTEAGKSALAVSFTTTADGPAITRELLFDPRSYALIGERETGGSAATLLDQGIVSHLGSQP